MIGCASPRRLRRGDRVAIVAPASPFSSDELTAGLDIIREVGLQPVLGPNVVSLKSTSIHAAPLGDRVEELMWAFTDSDIKGVFIATGGYGSAETLPYLDWDTVVASRKPLLGMSDITALNSGLARAGLASINGQSLSIRLNKGKAVRHSDSESLRLTLELMMSDQDWLERPLLINQWMPRMISPGSAQGHIVGGNLDTFSRLVGTPWIPDCRGAILFVEDVHKSGEILARELLHLQLAGMLDEVNGIVIGEFVDTRRRSNPEDIEAPTIEDVLQEFCADGPPCLYGFSFSHGDWTLPVPIGGRCSIDADKGIVTFGFRMAP